MFSQEISFDIKKIYAEVDNNITKDESIYTSNEPSEEKIPVHEKLYEQKSTLVDELKKEPADTVLDYHKKRKIESIKKNISIQQRFRFVRELFEEDDEIFSETIDFLDNCSGNDDASSYLNDKFLNIGKWNNEDEAVIEFLSVVKKKFPD
jgi:hypothetical protein